MFDVISTREFATITTFTTLFIIFLIKSKEIRASTINLLVSFFDPIVFLILDLFALYEVIVLLFLSYLPFWKCIYYKDFAFWLLLCGYPTLIGNNRTDQKGFRDLIWKQFIVSSIAEYLTGLITFNLLVEYVLLIICSFLVIFDTYIETSGRSSKLLKTVLGIIGITIITMTIRKVHNEFEHYNNLETLIKMLIPIGLYLSSIPFLYFYSLISRYQELFCIISLTEEKNDTHSMRRREALLWCGLCLKRVLSFRLLYPRYPDFTKEQFRLIIRKKLTIDQLMDIIYPDV